MPTETAQADDREAILRVEREVRRAIRGKDAEALAGLLAEDFVHRSPGGALTGRSHALSRRSIRRC